MGFEFVFFVYLLPYIVLYGVGTHTRLNYIKKYKPEVDINNYLKISAGRYYAQRIIINWVIMILSINNKINYNSDYGSWALMCFFLLVAVELAVFFYDDIRGSDCLAVYFNSKLKHLFALINKFKINKKNQINE